MRRLPRRPRLARPLTDPRGIQIVCRMAAAAIERSARDWTGELGKPMPVSKEDVRDAYRLLLGRSPESEATIDSHTVHADVPALVRFILDADEFRSRNGVVRPHPHHIYRGYTAADLDVLHQFERFSGPGCPGFVTSFLGTRYRVGFAPGLLSVDGSVENYPEPGGSYQGETAEFIGTLRSVLDARDGRYRMLECGAGYGTWMAVSYAAAIQKGTYRHLCLRRRGG